MADLYMSNITGLLDVDSIVQGLLQAKARNIQALQNKRATLQAQASSLSNLLGALNELNNFVGTINVSNLFKGKKVTVGDKNILSAVAQSETPNINIRNLTVSKLSQEEIRISQAGTEDLNSTLDPATFTLRYFTSSETYEEREINFSGGTLRDLVNAINSAQQKVEASILFDGTSYKLMLSEKDVANSSKETTTNNAVIEISSGNLPTQLGALETLQTAQNAEIKIGSNTFTSSSNTFNNIISGLTLTVYNPGTTYLSVEDDYSQVSSTLNSLLEKINSLIELINSQTSKGGIFQGNAVITQIKPQIFSLMKPLTNLGIINLDDKGKYSLNTDSLNTLIKENLNTLQSAITQVKSGFSSALEDLISVVNRYKSIQDRQIDSINQKIETLQKTLKKEEEKLRLEFSKIEALMYHNERLRLRLESLAKPISEILED
uniref:Flagellar hook-associated protein 2 n=1 Tax=Thermodesulfobacterium geofontis TaxID=1295609 RepID=A0A7V6CDQ6_9BACT